jgi:hypothetical protein
VEEQLSAWRGAQILDLKGYGVRRADIEGMPSSRTDWQYLSSAKTNAVQCRPEGFDVMVTEVDPNESLKVTTMLTTMALRRHNFGAVITQAMFP